MSQEPASKLVLISPVNTPELTTDATFAPRLTSLQTRRVGLLDNSKTNSDRMLKAIATILETQYGCQTTVQHRKPSASKPAATEIIEEFTKSCDLAIVGVGD